MKIAPAAIDRFIAKPDAAVRAVLVYGPDAGLVTERIKALMQGYLPKEQDDPFLRVDLAYDQLKDSPALLAEEMAAMSFFSNGRRVIRIADMPASLPKPIEEILASPPGDAIVLIAGDDLPPRSSLRAFFEKEPYCAAVPCYKDDIRTLANVSRETLKAHGLTFDDQVISYIQYRFVGDRSVLLNELEKLALYMGAETHITLDHLQSIMGEHVESSVDALCEALAASHYKVVEMHLQRLFHEGAQPGMILRMLQRYFSRLHYVKARMRAGMPEDEALKGLVPPLFFKQQAAFSRDLHRWSEAKLLHVLQLLIRGEKFAKQSGVPTETTTRQMIATIARIA
jgi:DNA polymerase-3 subunit delta